MPVRKIKYNYRNITGRLSKGKGIGEAEFESSLERDYLTTLEFSPSVESFEVQPVRIHYEFDGEQRSYTPDVLISYRAVPGAAPRKKLLVEVKYREELKANWAWYRRKLKAAVRFARLEGYQFRVMTEVEIRTPYFENAKFLLPYRNEPLEDPHFPVILDKLRELRESDPDTLTAAIYLDPWNRARVLYVLWQCVAQGYIGTDLSQPLTMGSRIWLAQ